MAENTQEVKPKEPVKARVLTTTWINDRLVDGNRVALINSDLADSLFTAGAIDPHESAVDYALSLNSEIIDTTVALD